MIELSRCVVPRVRFFEDAERVPLPDVIDRIACGPNIKVVRLDGVDCEPALDFLRNCFVDDPRIHVCRSPRFRFDSQDTRVWIHNDPNITSSRTLTIAPWDRDDVIQHLLLNRPDQCASVLSRIDPEDFGMIQSGLTVWSCIVESMVTAAKEQDFIATLRSILLSRLPLEGSIWGRRQDWRWLGDQLLTPGSVDRLLRLSDDPVFKALLQMSKLRFQIESDRIVDLIEHSNKKILQTQHSNELLTEVGRRLRNSPMVPHFLKKCVYRSYASTAASLLTRIEPDWKPPQSENYLFQNADLANAQWSGVSLENVKFGHAYLPEICLDDSELANATFQSDNCRGASFVDARMKGMIAKEASFLDANFFRAKITQSKWYDCDLRMANFSGSNLSDAAFAQCDLTDASFRACVASEVEFRECKFAGADFTDSNLNGSNFHALDLRDTLFCRTQLHKSNFHRSVLESIRMQRCSMDDALFSEAYLSWSSMIECSLQGVCLVNARLGEVDWELCNLQFADLRGVTFHYGSTRCGIVDSPYPSHGTRTGFYTDDREDLYFQAPEAVRKASLVGCDLRGANIEGVDFYLVDLRDAILEPEQRRQIAASGGILQ